MLEPVHIENDRFLVHTFRAADIKKEKAISKDVFALFSDEVTTCYLPGKKLSSLQEAEVYFRANLLSYHAGKNFLHFVTDKKSQRIIGMIDLISPGLAKEHYRLSHYPYFIEFYLKTEFHNQGIMGELLPEFIKQLEKKNIKDLSTVVNQKNWSAKKVS